MNLDWIPGVAAAVSATVHTLWLRWRYSEITARRVSELNRQIAGQEQHALMLWPRPWLGNRHLTQVEQITDAHRGWLGDPLDPEEQRRQMMEDSQRLMDSYRPPQDAADVQEESE